MDQLSQYFWVGEVSFDFVIKLHPVKFLLVLCQSGKIPAERKTDQGLANFSLILVQIKKCPTFLVEFADEGALIGVHLIFGGLEGLDSGWVSHFSEQLDYESFMVEQKGFVIHPL